MDRVFSQFHLDFECHLALRAGNQNLTPCLSNQGTCLIVRTLIQLKNDGKADSTIRRINYALKTINRHTDISNPEAVKDYIANSKRKDGKPNGEETKNSFAFAYDKLCQLNAIEWKKPHWKFEPKIPLMPTKENINKILSSATEKYCCIFTILAETGAEPHEIERTPRNLIDIQQGIISIQGHKGHLSGTYKLTNQTAEMLRKYLSKHPEEYPFPNSKVMGQVWRETRQRAITKYCQPDLKKIPLKNLRNYSGGQLYYKLLDPLAVKHHLRHKKLETTMHYLSGMPQTNNEEEYTVKTAKNLTEATTLIEQGFQYVTEMENIKIFKKKK